MKPGGKLKEVTLPSGGKVTIPDDGKPFEVSRVPGGERIKYGDGGIVTFRTVQQTAPKAAMKAATKAAAPGLSMEAIADGLVKVIAPILKKQNAKLADLEARIQEIERRG